MRAWVIIPRSLTNTTRLRPTRSLSFLIANQATFRTLHARLASLPERPTKRQRSPRQDLGWGARGPGALPDGDHSMMIFGATRLIPAPT